MVKLVEVVKEIASYRLREVFINPKHIISLREDDNMKKKLNEGKLPNALDERQNFTKVILDKGTSGQELIVIGDPVQIEKKLRSNKKEVLYG